MTAASLGLLSCHTCALLSPGGTRCRRCGSPLHTRKPDSISRAWAFLIASVALYIPANVLPIMETSSLFGAQRDTIMSGVVFLWKTGSWHLALIVFIAFNWILALRVLPAFERYKPARPLADSIARRAGPDDVVAHFDVSLPSMVFYLRRHIDIGFDAESRFVREARTSVTHVRERAA